MKKLSIEDLKSKAQEISTEQQLEVKGGGGVIEENLDGF